jgi:putative peptidoglycan lipid II flippase
MFLTLPAATALIVVATPIIRVLFEHGAFGPEATIGAANALMAYAAGLPAFVLVKVLTPGFFAREDTKTPVKIAVVCVALNVALNFGLMNVLGHVGLALSLSISGWLNVALLTRGLYRRGHFKADPRLKRRALAIAGASAVMAGVLYGLELVLHDALRGSESMRVLGLVALVAGGLGAYVGTARLFRAFTLRELLGSLRRRDGGQPAAGEKKTGAA